MKTKLRLAVGMAMLAILLPPAGAWPNRGIVKSVLKAPVSPDGLVCGRPSEMVINFDTSMDPHVPGRTLLAGKTIKITLPDDFVSDGRDLLQAGTCDFLMGCNSAVLLQGWPQNPIAPPTYALSYEGTHTIVFTAKQNLGPVSLQSPGIKQTHLIIRGFTNPGPGYYPILVEAETGPGGALETGVGYAHIIPDPRPNLNVVSVFDNPPPAKNKIYQETTPGELAPLPLDFLLWDGQAQPFLGVEIKPWKWCHGYGSSTVALLVKDHRVVGHVWIHAPRGATGMEVFTTEPSKLVNAPVTGFPSGLLRAFFRAGNTLGDYTITFRLYGGNSVKMHVSAVTMSTSQIVDFHIADINGNPPTDPSTPIYNSRRCDPAVPNPMTAPDGHIVTLGEWTAASGKAYVKCLADGTRATIKMTGLIPNGIYTVWLFTFQSPGFDGTFDYRIGAGSLGANNGSQNTFLASATGTGEIVVTAPPGPLSVFGNISDCLLDEFEFHLVGAYHPDGLTYGATPGANCKFVEQFGFVFQP